ncbi:translational elongation factor EF-1 alpha [Rhizophlyctis rosea]|nr:translational elongation factor EF-1 alpha [Rhizophlyctis rosea]
MGLEEASRRGELGRKWREAATSDVHGTREGAALLFERLTADFGADIEPYLHQYFPVLLRLTSDVYKMVWKAARPAKSLYLEFITPYAASNIITSIIPSLMDPCVAAQIQGWEIVNALASRYPAELLTILPKLLQALSTFSDDTIDDIKTAAMEALRKIFAVEPDEPEFSAYIFDIINAICGLVPTDPLLKRLHHLKLHQRIETSTLTLPVTLFVRGLKSNQVDAVSCTVTLVRRVSMLVISGEGYCLMLEGLGGDLERVSKTVPEPALIAAATTTRELLRRFAVTGFNSDTEVGFDEFQATIASVVLKHTKSQIYEPLLKFLTITTAELIKLREWNLERWKAVYAHGLGSIHDQYMAEAISLDVLVACKSSPNPARSNLVKSRFTLKVGNAGPLPCSLPLQRGHRYGICVGDELVQKCLLKGLVEGEFTSGDGDASVKALMIDGQLEDDFRSVMVSEYVCKEVGSGVNEQEVVEALKVFGVGGKLLKLRMDTLKGSQRKKVVTVTSLMKNRGADLMVLYEITARLDRGEMTWLIDYMDSNPMSVFVIASDDSPPFLEVASDLILSFHDESFEIFPGSLTEFCDIHRERYPLSRSIWSRVPLVCIPILAKFEPRLRHFQRDTLYSKDVIAEKLEQPGGVRWALGLAVSALSGNKVPWRLLKAVQEAAGKPVLAAAAFLGYDRLVRCFLNMGARKEVVGGVTRIIRPIPLDITVFLDRVCLPGSWRDQRTIRGMGGAQTLLHWAVHGKHPSIVKMIVSAGAPFDGDALRSAIVSQVEPVIDVICPSYAQDDQLRETLDRVVKEINDGEIVVTQAIADVVGHYWFEYPDPRPVAAGVTSLNLEDLEGFEKEMQKDKEGKEKEGEGEGEEGGAAAADGGKGEVMVSPTTGGGKGKGKDLPVPTAEMDNDKDETSDTPGGGSSGSGGGGNSGGGGESGLTPAGAGTNDGSSSTGGKEAGDENGLEWPPEVGAAVETLIGSVMDRYDAKVKEARDQTKKELVEGVGGLLRKFFNQGKQDL